MRVLVTAYLENRASDFDDFFTKLHLDESKKCSKRIFENNSCFRDIVQIGQFLPFFAIFSQKIRFLDIFFQFAHQTCLKLGQKLGTVALNHLMAVLWFKNTLHVVTLYGFGRFWPFYSKPLISLFIFFI